MKNFLRRFQNWKERAAELGQDDHAWSSSVTKIITRDGGRGGVDGLCHSELSGIAGYPHSREILHFVQDDIVQYDSKRRS